MEQLSQTVNCFKAHKTKSFYFGIDVISWGCESVCVCVCVCVGVGGGGGG